MAFAMVVAISDPNMIDNWHNASQWIPNVAKACVIAGIGGGALGAIFGGVRGWERQRAWRRDHQANSP
jgi:hypothetical protein